MDPLSCLSVAGTAVQFCQFSCSIISESWKIYKNGELQVHAQAADAASEIRGFSVKLQQSLRQEGVAYCMNRQESSLTRLCRDCAEVADDLVARLGKLKTEKGHPWKSLTQALSSAWNKDELEKLQARLTHHVTTINFGLLGELRNGMDDLAVQESARFDILDLRTKQILEALFEIRASSTTEHQAQMAALALLFDRRNVVVGNDKKDGGVTVVDISSAEGTEISEDEHSHCRDIRAEERVAQASVAMDILETLRFEGIEDRFEEVVEAHRKTLTWIFEGSRDNDADPKHWSNFVEWLRNDHGLYWISGKAASGKSTLMKYIYTHHEMTKHLSMWAGTSSYQVAGFFFWNSGTKLQKSQSGLFRSLLFEILKKVPDLIPIVLSERWAALYALKMQPTRIVLKNTWTPAELKTAFQILVTQKIIPLKLCLFIDGLDEYEGEDIDMAALLKQFRNLTHIKICASSRPHVVFQDAFQECPGLRLEDHTQLDIRFFVSDSFLNDESMQRLKISEPNTTSAVSALENEILEYANGVFLWVKLVVTSLLNGIRQHDRILDLQKRLRLLPKKLEDLYHFMVIQVDDYYKEEASRMFQLLDSSQYTETDWTRNSVPPITIFSLNLAVEYNMEFALSAGSKFMPQAEIKYSCQETASRIKSRCGGLLEVAYPGNRIENIEPDMKVSYLHRTVRDFLTSVETKGILIERTGGSSPHSFSPDMALLASCILQLKAYSNMHWYQMHGIMDTAINHCLRIQRTNPQETFEGIYDELWKYFELRLQNQARSYDSKLALAVQCGLNSYLHKILPNIAQLRCSQTNTPLLDYAVNPSRRKKDFVNLDTVNELLKCGADPNELYLGVSPWQNALSYLNNDYPQWKNLHLWADVILLLIQYNADDRTRSQGPERENNKGSNYGDKARDLKQWYPEEVIKRVFADEPTLQKKLLNALKQNKSTTRKITRLFGRLRLENK